MQSRFSPKGGYRAHSERQKRNTPKRRLLLRNGLEAQGKTGLAVANHPRVATIRFLSVTLFEVPLQPSALFCLVPGGPKIVTSVRIHPVLLESLHSVVDGEDR